MRVYYFTYFIFIRGICEIRVRFISHIPDRLILNAMVSG